MSNLTIQFLNYSKKQWNPDKNKQELQYLGNSIQTWPNGPLLALDGEQTCIITQNLAKIDTAPSKFYFCWNDGIWRFGVKIHAYFQAFYMGDRPTWEIMYDQYINSTAPINWIQNDNSPGVQYTWPTSIGYQIIATPTSGHGSLEVQVVINDLTV